MNLTTTLLATKAGGTQGIISMVVIYAAIIAIFWFFAIRPQKKQQKEHDALVSTLAVQHTHNKRIFRCCNRHYG